MTEPQTARWLHDPTVPDLVKDWAHMVAGLFDADLHTRLLDEVALREAWLDEHPALRAGVLHQRAYAASETGDLVLAIRSCKAALKADPDFAKARGNLDHLRDRAKDRLQLLYHQDRWSESEPIARVVIETYGPVPDFASWHLGVALDQQGRSDEAVAVFKELVDRTPGHESAWASLVVSLRHARRPEEGLTALDEGVQTLRRLGRETEPLERLRSGLLECLRDGGDADQLPLVLN